MFIDINEYMLKDRDERRNHLNLDDLCIEIGGDSRLFRGLLAHHLKTTVGDKKVYVCHACHNHKCSNPNHLYWGNPTDNYIDQIENGTYLSIFERTKNKYGEEEYKKMMKEAGKKGGKAGGGHNKLGKEIIQSRIDDYFKDQSTWGKTARLSKKWNCSHTQVKRFVDTYIKSNGVL